MFLKVDEDCAEVMSEGKLFQTRGAATPKARSPSCFSVWNAGRPVCDSTQIRVAYVHESSSTAHCKSLARYSGAVLLRQRNTRTPRQNAIRSGMRSQCRSRSRGVIWSYFRPLHNNLAAAFSTDCRRSCKRRDIPMRFTLPYSKRDSTNEVTREKVKLAD